MIGMDENRRPRTGRFYFNTNISCAGSSIRYEWTSREGRAQAGFNSIPMFLAQGAVYDMDEYRRPRRMRVWSRTLERSGRCVFVCVLCVSLYFVQWSTSTPYFHFQTVYTVRLRYGTFKNRIIPSKEKHGPNRISLVDRFLPFCREKGGLGQGQSCGFCCFTPISFVCFSSRKCILFFHWRHEVTKFVFRKVIPNDPLLQQVGTVFSPWHHSVTVPYFTVYMV